MPNSSNLLLGSLSASDVAALQPHLKPVYLEHETILFEARGKVAAVYFPTGAIVSLVVGLSSGEMIEAAMVGKDGVVGASAALDGNISVNRGIVQLAGPALTCSMDALKGAALQSRTLSGDWRNFPWRSEKCPPMAGFRRLAGGLQARAR